MFEVVATQRSKGRSGFSPGLLALSAGFHAVVLLAASQIPTRAGPTLSGALPDETVTFLRLPRMQQTPVPGKQSAALTSRPATAPSARADRLWTEPPLPSPNPTRDIPPELPDVVPVAMMAGTFLPDGVDASAPDAPSALSWTAEALSLGGSARSRGRSTGELGDPSRISEHPTLLNEASMRRIWRTLYPDSLNKKGVEGQAVASFIINTDGSVDPASIYMISASHSHFRDATAMGLLELRFSPARQRGRIVRVRVKLPVQWRLNGW